MFSSHDHKKEENTTTMTLNHGMLTHTYHCCVMVSGAAQTLALHWSLLPSHCSKNGRGRKQCLTHPWTHSHQPKQVHGVWPVSYGEDHLREAERGARGSDSYNLSAPLLPSLYIPLSWKVIFSFSFAYSCYYCWYIAPVCIELVKHMLPYELFTGGSH